VLLSTLRISLTCGPLGPAPARTSSVAPGGMLPWPLRSTTPHVQERIARPIGKLYEAESLVGLYHLTTAWIGGPEGASNLWALDPDAAPKLRRGVSKLSSSKATATAGAKVSVSAN
jgi:hypothetical protein